MRSPYAPPVKTSLSPVEQSALDKVMDAPAPEQSQADADAAFAAALKRSKARQTNPYL